MGNIVGGMGSAVGGNVIGGVGSAVGGIIGGVGSAVGGVGGVGSVVGGLASGSATAAAPAALASWSLAANASATILSLQQVSIPAVFLAIYRITNTGVSFGSRTGGSVVVETDHGRFTLDPGNSMDISTQTLTLRTGRGKAARGTYQLLCNAMAGNRPA